MMDDAPCDTPACVGLRDRRGPLNALLLTMYGSLGDGTDISDRCIQGHTCGFSKPDMMDDSPCDALTCVGLGELALGLWMLCS